MMSAEHDSSHRHSAIVRADSDGFGVKVIPDGPWKEAIKNPDFISKTFRPFAIAGISGFYAAAYEQNSNLSSALQQIPLDRPAGLFIDAAPLHRLGFFADMSSATMNLLNQGDAVVAAAHVASLLERKIKPDDNYDNLRGERVRTYTMHTEETNSKFGEPVTIALRYSQKRIGEDKFAPPTCLQFGAALNITTPQTNLYVTLKLPYTTTESTTGVDFSADFIEDGQFGGGYLKGQEQGQLSKLLGILHKTLNPTS